jgi:hypothetical protein
MIKDKKQLPEGFVPHQKYEQTSILGGIVSDEILCPHGIGHEPGVHGCDGCCEQLLEYWGIERK